MISASFGGKHKLPDIWSTCRPTNWSSQFYFKLTLAHKQDHISIKHSHTNLTAALKLVPLAGNLLLLWKAKTVFTQNVTLTQETLPEAGLRRRVCSVAGKFLPLVAGASNWSQKATDKLLDKLELSPTPLQPCGAITRFS